MSYRFISGSCGSGKTFCAYTECIEKSVEFRDKRFIILVPEQYTMQTQREIVRLHPKHATGNIEVLSFNRLAYKVFNELGISTPELIDDIGKAMIIRKVAFDRHDGLGVWKEQFSRAGFVDSVKSMLSEFYQYGIGADKISELLRGDSLKPVLKGKLSDMETVYRGFEDFKRERFISSEELPDVLLGCIDRSGFFDGADVIIDGFTGFTPIQYRLIEKILKRAEEVCFTITADSFDLVSGKLRESELFHMSSVMLEKIRDIAGSNQIAEKEYTDMNRIFEGNLPRFKSAPSISALEKHFLRYDGSRSEAGEDIRIVKAAEPDEEVSYISSEIIRLIKEEGYRYRDIAVVTGDMAAYSDRLANRFYNLEVPYFIDASASVANNPLPELISAVLDIAAEDYSYEAVMRYLKCPLSGADEKTVWIMDRYMLECGIRGLKLMKRSWDYLPASLEGIDLPKLNGFKNELIERLSVIYGLIRGEGLRASDMEPAITGFLEGLGVRERLMEMSESFAELDIPDALYLSREYSEVYDKVIDLIKTASGILGEERLGRREFPEILKAGFEQLGVGMIPASADRVVIGDITRSRLDDIRALFLIGVNDGIIPKLKERRAVINDREKEILKGLGVELSPTVREDVFIQRYYIYRMLAKPSSCLYISYCGMDSSGRSMKESNIIGSIASVFTNLRTGQASDFKGIRSRYQANEYIAENLRNIRLGIEPENRRLFTALMNMGLESSKKLKKAAFYINRESGIGREAALAIFGEELRGSATRIEKYIECPYSHFMRYGLGIEESRDYGLEAADIGNLMHAVLEKAFFAAKRDGIKLEELRDEERDKRVETAAAEALMDDEKNIYTYSAKNKYIAKRLESLAKRTVWALSAQLSYGDFIPYEFEKSFSDRDAADSLRLGLDYGAVLRLSGKIDRVDICENDKNLLVKIIDYKTGGTSWESDLTYYGRQMQLVLYMDAVSELLAKRFSDKEILPAALLYYHIDDPLIDIDDTGDGIDTAVIRALRPSGLVNTDLDIIRHLDRNIEKYSDVLPVALKDGVINEARSSAASTGRIGLLRRYVKDKLKSAANDILAGNINRIPYKRGTATACDYCPYRAVCGFDSKIPGFNYNRMNRLKSDEVWEKIKEYEKLD